MFRKFACLLALITILAVTPALARVQMEKLVLDNTLEGTTPAFSVVEQNGSMLKMQFTLPAIDVEQVTVGSESFQALTISGGGISGAAGQAGLPNISRLLAIPEGASVSVSVTGTEPHRFQGLRVFPVQPDEATSLVIDRDYYSSSMVDQREMVELGEPGIMNHLRVVPITINPVTLNPATGEITAYSRVELSIDFSGVDNRAEIPRSTTVITESFAHLYESLVINWEASDLYRDAEVSTGPGTYLIISRDNSTVLNLLQPLVDWRKRQGYNVVQATTTQTGTTTTSIKNYIQSLYNTVDPPLEFVTLAGDASGTYSIPTYREYLSGYSGEGDHYYTMLSGDDIIADVNIGRLTFTTTGELENEIDKIVNYEKYPPTTDSGWFTRACVTGDRGSSGITTIYVNQWLKDQLLDHGYTQVDTIWSSPFRSQMMSSLSQGLTVFGYRGYLGMSGLDSGYILSLNNGYELPLAIVVTCGTGSFWSDTTCPSEAFLKAPNGGGIGAVGTATWGTHTRYNNCYYHGVWQGAINDGDHRIGVAHSRGKLELYNNYIQGEPNKAEIWAVWNNLMGDPATDMWTGYPEALSVNYSPQLPTGAVSVPVSVSSLGHPLAGARVALVKGSELRSVGYTDSEGYVNLPVSGLTAGDLLVTVIHHNRMPHRGSISVGGITAYAALSNIQIDDDNINDSKGNGDQLANPAELVELSLSLRNLGSSALNNVTATISSNDPYVTIYDDDEEFGDIPVFGENWCLEDYDFRISPEAPDGHQLRFEVRAFSGLDSWTSLLEIPVVAAKPVITGFSWGGGGSTLDPGESGLLTLPVRNDGSRLATGVTATLSCNSTWITIDNPFGTYDDVPVGMTAEGNELYVISIDADYPDGGLATFTLTLQFNEESVATTEYVLNVGSANSNDPLGPDSYGYYAFDNTDTSYPQAPTYNWIEIDPTLGGSGTVLPNSDYGWEQDDTDSIDLPFNFRYYGENFDRISICSNGWMALGDTYLRHYRNWSLPCAGAPGALISPFWDNLYLQSGYSKMVHQYDSTDHKFIIEWSRLKNQQGGATETFQAILFDPNFHPTATGDGEILFQYKTISNTDGTNGYGTVGIQKPDRSDALLYTYWNHYSSGAATLTAGRAIRFLPQNNALVPRITSNPDHVERTLLTNSTGNNWVEIGNNGDSGSVLYYAVDGDGAMPTWLSVDRQSGSLAVGENATIMLAFDTSGLDEGLYETNIVIGNNGPAPKVIPVYLTVDNSGTGGGEVPAVLSLGQNHPNPFNPTTSIDFGLPTAESVKLEVFDVNGRTVKVLVAGQLAAGLHRVTWDGTDQQGESLASGIYFYRLQTEGQDLKRKMLLLK